MIFYGVKLNRISISVIGFAILIVIVSLVFNIILHVGNTWGLRENLKKMDGVVRVDDYKVREGKASFLLVLNNGTIYLNGIGNKDIEKSNGIMISKIDSRKIKCKQKNHTIFSNGMTARAFQLQYIPDKDLSNIQSVISNYMLLKQFILKDQLFFYFPDGPNSVESHWVCKFIDIKKGGRP